MAAVVMASGNDDPRAATGKGEGGGAANSGERAGDQNV